MLVIAFSRHVSVVSVVSGDWLLALPNANCGLRLDDEAVRVAVGMRLGLSLCVPHNCHCGILVDAQGLHAMVCKKAPGKIARHRVFNDIWRPRDLLSVPANFRFDTAFQRHPAARELC